VKADISESPDVRREVDIHMFGPQMVAAAHAVTTVGSTVAKDRTQAPVTDDVKSLPMTSGSIRRIVAPNYHGGVPAQTGNASSHIVQSG